MKIVVNSKLSVEENAQLYFEKAKNAKKKLEGAKKALIVSKQKLEAELKKKQERIKNAQTNTKKTRRKTEWYEKFRWFFSSDGFLVIGGRDATTNEIVIKKHTDKQDVVFHTDMAGSPFFVIKCGEKVPGEETLQEVADATLCFSRAWKLGLMTAAVFYVSPDQVTKEANSGEFVPKGAFMIRGKTNYLSPSPNCAIGLLKDGRVMCGPTPAVKSHCAKFFEIKQGDKKPSEIARFVKKNLGGELDDIIRVLPSGGVDFR